MTQASPGEGLGATALPTGQILGPHLLELLRHEQQEEDQAIVNTTLVLSLAYANASGGDLANYAVLENLFANGWMIHPVSEVERVFGSEEIFLAASQRQYEEDLAARQAYEQEALAQITAAGDELPSEFFIAVGFYQKKARKNGSRPVRRRKENNMGRFVVGVVDSRTAIARYKTYLMALRLAPYETYKESLPDSEKKCEKYLERMLSIALGFSLDSGARLSTFPSEILKANEILNRGRVEAAIREEPYREDYVLPNLTRKYYGALLKAGQAPQGQPLAGESG